MYGQDSYDLDLHKLQLEAGHSSKQSDPERNLEGNTSITGNAIEGKQAWSNVLPKEAESRSKEFSDYDRSILEQ